MPTINTPYADQVQNGTGAPIAAKFAVGQHVFGASGGSVGDYGIVASVLCDNNLGGYPYTSGCASATVYQITQGSANCTFTPGLPNGAGYIPAALGATCATTTGPAHLAGLANCSPAQTARAGYTPSGYYLSLNCSGGPVDVEAFNFGLHNCVELNITNSATISTQTTLVLNNQFDYGVYCNGTANYATLSGYAMAFLGNDFNSEDDNIGWLNNFNTNKFPNGGMGWPASPAVWLATSNLYPKNAYAIGGTVGAGGGYVDYNYLKGNFSRVFEPTQANAGDWHYDNNYWEGMNGALAHGEAYLQAQVINSATAASNGLSFGVGAAATISWTSSAAGSSSSVGSISSQCDTPGSGGDTACGAGNAYSTPPEIAITTGTMGQSCAPLGQLTASVQMFRVGGADGSPVYAPLAGVTGFLGTGTPGGTGSLTFSTSGSLTVNFDQIFQLTASQIVGVQFQSTGTLPGGISASTTYWIVPSSTLNSAKIATSPANALAGIYITSGSAPTGTVTMTPVGFYVAVPPQSGTWPQIYAGSTHYCASGYASQFDAAAQPAYTFGMTLSDGNGYTAVTGVPLSVNSSFYFENSLGNFTGTEERTLLISSRITRRTVTFTSI